jgi:competence protein ComEC
MVLVLVALSLVIPGCGWPGQNGEGGVQEELPPAPEAGPAPGEPSLGEGELSAHFIDVGQGDSILLRLPNGESVLIDAGDNGASSTVIAYLKVQGIAHIHHLIATHPHADHIGGMAAVIREFSVGEVYMPRTSHTTITYERLLLAIQEKGLRITEARAGVTMLDEPGLRASFLAPFPREGLSLNDSSAVLKVEYGSVSLLFTGDAEAESEGHMLLSSSMSPRADILKAGHHGSQSSSSEVFLEAVSPSIAIISAGEGNSYGHPHKEVLERLQGMKVEILRTDLHGTIVITTGGESFSVKTERESPG